MKKTAVIMAGGSGERFWPVSRKRNPKQLLNLSGDRKMIQVAVDRVGGLIPPEDVFVVTGAHLLEPIRNALPELPPENVIAEPAKRNTAPCLALGAAFVAEKYSDEFAPNEIVMSVLTADHVVEPEDKFLETIDSAMKYVAENESICVVGIPPTRPETGYGYIEIDSPFDKDAGALIKPVRQFREKPDKATANKFLEAGTFLWNGGMFFWRLDYFVEQMRKHLPEVGSKIEAIRERYRGKTGTALYGALSSIEELFAGFPNTSIDFGLMEKADSISVVKALFKWDDIGSWDSLDRARSKDADGNISVGEAVFFDAKDSIIFSDSASGEKIVAAFGVENLAIVSSDDAVLVCPKDRVQEVKKIVEKLKKSGKEKYL